MSLLNFPLIFLLLSGNSYGASIKENSLYDASDPIKLLDIHNFKETIVNKPIAWLVEFYSSWCGHCISFAPTFKQLARNVSSWRKVISVAAVDCAQDENGPVCRDYEVMAYPTLKFFPPHSNETFLGVQRQGAKTVEKIKADMIEFVSNQQLPNFPNLKPIGDETLDELWSTYPENVQTLLLLFETSASDDTWSREVILDLTEFENFPPIRRVNINRQDLLVQFNIKSLPVVAAVSRKGLVNLTHVKPDRFKAADVLIKMFSSFQPTMEEKVASSQNEETPKTTHHISKVPKKDKVFMADLEKAVQYSLGHEISLHKTITGESFKALKSFVQILVDYFPGRPQVVRLLEKLRDKIDEIPGTIQGAEFSRVWEELHQRELPMWIEETRDWRGCKGSQPNRRGYPCSLWSLFHALTVSHASKSRADPPLVLKTMKKYIKKFFGCAECAKHFLAMTEDPVDSIEQKVKNAGDAVLWLWEAHNKANKRLAGDATEDPEFPKIQFPSTWNCPSCRDKTGQYIKEKVYDYLMSLYGKDNLGMENLVEDVGSRFTGSDNEVHLTSGAVSLHRTSWNFVMFNGFDISLCVFLYLFSCFIIFVVLFKFVLKRRYRKKANPFLWYSKLV